MTPTDIRALNDHLSCYRCRIEAGERIAIIAHGRAAAELIRLVTTSRVGRRRRFEECVAAGVPRSLVEICDPLKAWPNIQLAPGPLRN